MTTLPSTNVWHHWELLLEYGSSKTTKTVMLDGAKNVSVSADITFGSTVSVLLGPEHVFANRKWDSVFDNLLVTEEP